LATRAAIQI
jgi:hypothetical protein